MARTRAGKTYPYTTTDARQHDHRFCGVVQAIVARARAGQEEWGTVHPMPAVTSAAIADEAKRGLYRARKHGYSVRAVVVGPGGQLAAGGIVPADQYVVELQVWSRAAAREYIVQKVQSGESLAYNVRRMEQGLCIHVLTAD